MLKEVLENLINESVNIQCEFKKQSIDDFGVFDNLEKLENFDLLKEHHKKLIDAFEKTFGKGKEYYKSPFKEVEINGNSYIYSSEDYFIIGADTPSALEKVKSFFKEYEKSVKKQLKGNFSKKVPGLKIVFGGNLLDFTPFKLDKSSVKWFREHFLVKSIPLSNYKEVVSPVMAIRVTDKDDFDASFAVALPNVNEFMSNLKNNL